MQSASPTTSVELDAPGAPMLQACPPGMSKQLWQALSKIVRAERGLFIACGPAGSGRTTTLHRLVGTAFRTRRVVAIEAPIEEELRGATQIELDQTETPKEAWAQALKAALGHTPEILLIGEIRDSESARAALEAASTQLVLATMHSASSADVALRICSLGGELGQFIETFIGAVAQRLVPIVCPHCAVIGRPTAEFEELAAADEIVLRTNREGCPHCVDGAIGLQFIYEACLIEDSSDRGILEQAGSTVRGVVSCLESLRRRQGMALAESALELAKEKRIALTEYAKL